ncbi:hypothetical protein R1sor_007858 [Riccia sorocarpa]|uniref:Uncharacterized protein n=1 Tax=Riccia sorocarpa TaxID=122646 RepID=A0ABD3HUJ1_9MARC
MPRDKIAKSRGGIVAFDDSPVSHNTRLGVAKKQTFNQFLSGIESQKDDNSIAEADDSMTRSRREGESPQIETSEGPVQSGANSLRTTGSLAFNLEKYLLESSPQTNVGNRTQGGGAVTPDSRSSSVVKRGILRSPLAKGIKLNLFGEESGESGERFRAQTESIFMREEPEGVHFCASEQGELVREKGIVRTNLLAMSEVGQSSQVAPSPEGSNSAGRDQQISVFEEVSDRDRAPAESPKSGGVLRLISVRGTLGKFYLRTLPKTFVKW